MTNIQSVRIASDALDPIVDISSLPDAMEQMPDSMMQYRPFIDSVSTLEAHFHDRPDVFVCGNTMVCYNRRNLYDRVLPDCYVAFGVDAGAIAGGRAYAIWEVGKPPDFVMEIASPATAHRDMVFKRLLYAELGIGEYWRFDSTGGLFYGQPLIGNRLVDGAYRPIRLAANDDGLLSGYSDVMGLALCADGDRLRFYDHVAASHLRTASEEKAARLAAERRIRELETRLRNL